MEQPYTRKALVIESSSILVWIHGIREYLRPTPPGLLKQSNFRGPSLEVFKLEKAMYGTKQVAWRWHISLSDWMIDHDYEAVNSEKTIFIKREGDDFLIHATFVDDLKSITANNRLSPVDF
jgi:hypothetical protein